MEFDGANRQNTQGIRRVEVMSTQKYTVTVGDVQVHDFYLLWDEAVVVATDWIEVGCKDVRVERVVRPDLSLMV